jgi:hypothetical protein
MSDYPTLLALGLGPQLEAMENICALGQMGKYAGQPLNRDVLLQLEASDRHGDFAGENIHSRDAESGERHLLHAALRLLMADASIVDELEAF